MKYNYLADLRDGIPYRKSLRKYTGSVTASLLMQQLDFHFASYPDGFYKFLSSVPSHPDYRENDSWTEELGFSEKEFRHAFDCIGVRYTSKTSWGQVENPFINEHGEEKFYCSYFDKQKGLTWYFRNHAKVDGLVEELIKLTPPAMRKRPSKVEFPVAYQRESTGNSQKEACSLPKGISRDDQKEATFIYKENTKITTERENTLAEIKLDTEQPKPDPSQNTTVATLPIQAEIVVEVGKPSSSAIIPARENHSQNRAADRIRQTWQETGVVPKIPMELDAWAIADIGQEIIFAYRRSGRISTIGRGDIKPEFPAYVTSLNPGKDIDYGYTYIKKLETDPRNWETLASLVLKWQATVKTGDRNLNVVREVNRPSGPPIVLNL